MKRRYWINNLRRYYEKPWTVLNVNFKFEEIIYVLSYFRRGTPLSDPSFKLWLECVFKHSHLYLSPRLVIIIHFLSSSCHFFIRIIGFRTLHNSHPNMDRVCHTINVLLNFVFSYVIFMQGPSQLTSIECISLFGIHFVTT